MLLDVGVHHRSEVVELTIPEKIDDEHLTERTRRRTGERVINQKLSTIILDTNTHTNITSKKHTHITANTHTHHHTHKHTCKYQGLEDQRAVFVGVVIQDGEQGV